MRNHFAFLVLSFNILLTSSSETTESTTRHRLVTAKSKPANYPDREVNRKPFRKMEREEREPYCEKDCRFRCENGKSPGCDSNCQLFCWENCPFTGEASDWPRTQHCCKCLCTVDGTPGKWIKPVNYTKINLTDNDRFSEHCRCECDPVDNQCLREPWCYLCSCNLKTSLEVYKNPRNGSACKRNCKLLQKVECARKMESFCPDDCRLSCAINVSPGCTPECKLVCLPGCKLHLVTMKALPHVNCCSCVCHKSDDEMLRPVDWAKLTKYTRNYFQTACHCGCRPDFKKCPPNSRRECSKCVCPVNGHSSNFNKLESPKNCSRCKEGCVEIFQENCARRRFRNCPNGCKLFCDNGKLFGCPMNCTLVCLATCLSNMKRQLGSHNCCKCFCLTTNGVKWTQRPVTLIRLHANDVKLFCHCKCPPVVKTDCQPIGAKCYYCLCSLRSLAPYVQQEDSCIKCNPTCRLRKSSHCDMDLTIRPPCGISCTFECQRGGAKVCPVECNLSCKYSNKKTRFSCKCICGQSNIQWTTEVNWQIAAESISKRKCFCNCPLNLCRGPTEVSQCLYCLCPPNYQISETGLIPSTICNACPQNCEIKKKIQCQVTRTPVSKFSCDGGCELQCEPSIACRDGCALLCAENCGFVGRFSEVSEIRDCCICNCAIKSQSARIEVPDLGKLLSTDNDVYKNYCVCKCKFESGMCKLDEISMKSNRECICPLVITYAVVKNNPIEVLKQSSACIVRQVKSDQHSRDINSSLLCDDHCWLECLKGMNQGCDSDCKLVCLPGCKFTLGTLGECCTCVCNKSAKRLDDVRKSVDRTKMATVNFMDFFTNCNCICPPEQNCRQQRGHKCSCPLKFQRKSSIFAERDPLLPNGCKICRNECKQIYESSAHLIELCDENCSLHCSSRLPGCFQSCEIVCQPGCKFRGPESKTDEVNRCCKCLCPGKVFLAVNWNDILNSDLSVWKRNCRCKCPTLKPNDCVNKDANELCYTCSCPIKEKETNVETTAIESIIKTVQPCLKCPNVECTFTYDGSCEAELERRFQSKCSQGCTLSCVRGSVTGCNSNCELTCDKNHCKCACTLKEMDEFDAPVNWEQMINERNVDIKCGCFCKPKRKRCNGQIDLECFICKCPIRNSNANNGYAVAQTRRDTCLECPNIACEIQESCRSISATKVMQLSDICPQECSFECSRGQSPGCRRECRLVCTAECLFHVTPSEWQCCHCICTNGIDVQTTETVNWSDVREKAIRQHCSCICKPKSQQCSTRIDNETCYTCRCPPVTDLIINDKRINLQSEIQCLQCPIPDCKLEKILDCGGPKATNVDNKQQSCGNSCKVSCKIGQSPGCGLECKLACTKGCPFRGSLTDEKQAKDCCSCICYGSEGNTWNESLNWAAVHSTRSFQEFCSCICNVNEEKVCSRRISPSCYECICPLNENWEENQSNDQCLPCLSVDCKLQLKDECRK
ncbi:Uncharacterised protein g8074 [Pycnogonum litorale]